MTNSLWPLTVHKISGKYAKLPRPQAARVLLPARGSVFRMSVSSVQTELKATELLITADGGSVTESTLTACLFCLGKAKQNTLIRT